MINETIAKVKYIVYKNGIWAYICDKCKTDEIEFWDNYCRECGAKLKWKK